MNDSRVEALTCTFFASLHHRLTHQFAQGKPKRKREKERARTPVAMKRATHALLGLLLAGACEAQKLPLTTWSFRSQNGSVRVDNATVPGTSHMHLLDAGVIEDPYLRYNERECQWVAKESWIYETQVEVKENDVLAKSKLVFENLDGVAQIFVNDKLLASTASSFLSYSFGAENLLVRGSNRVKVVFTPPLDYASKKVAVLCPLGGVDCLLFSLCLAFPSNSLKRLRTLFLRRKTSTCGLSRLTALSSGRRAPTSAGTGVRRMQPLASLDPFTSSSDLRHLS